MDAEITAERLIQPFCELFEAGDFDGAERHLQANLDQFPSMAAWVHLQFGRLYIRWNKLTSALSHLGTAAELAHRQNDFMLLSLVQSELKLARSKQSFQRP